MAPQLVLWEGGEWGSPSPGDDGSRQAPGPGGQELPHEQPGYGAPPQGEGDHVDHEGQQGHQGGGGGGVVVVAQQQEAAHHAEAGDVQQHLRQEWEQEQEVHLATQPVDQQVGEDSGEDVDNAQDDGGDVWGGGARSHEDGHRVEHDCVDAGELLTGHETDTDTQGPEVRGG